MEAPLWNRFRLLLVGEVRVDDIIRRLVSFAFGVCGAIRLGTGALLGLVSLIRRVFKTTDDLAKLFDVVACQRAARLIAQGG